MIGKKTNYHYNNDTNQTYNIISGAPIIKPTLNQNTTPGEQLAHAFAEDMNYQCRPQMEDMPIQAVDFPSKGSHLLGILDGHGGKDVVKYVQKVLPETIKKEYSDRESPEAIFKRCFAKVDSQLKLFGASDMGCTACVALCLSTPGALPTLHIANIGDCRAVVGCKDGSALRLTNDHKASEKSEQERVRKANGTILNNRVNGTLAITRAFGDFDLKKAGVISEPECCSFKVEAKHSVLIIACDGVWDVMEDEMAVGVVMAEQDLGQMATKLVKKALAGGTRDNVSVLVVRLN